MLVVVLSKVTALFAKMKEKLDLKWIRQFLATVPTDQYLVVEVHLLSSITSAVQIFKELGLRACFMMKMVIHWPKQCTPNENYRSTENVIMKFAGFVRVPCFYRLRLLAVIKENDITNSCEALHNVVNTAAEMGNYKAVL